jgi:hypothetical protein
MEAGRLNAYKAAPDAMRAVQQVEAYIQRCGLEKSLIELVKMRASQIVLCNPRLPHLSSSICFALWRVFFASAFCRHPFEPERCGSPFLFDRVNN